MTEKDKDVKKPAETPAATYISLHRVEGGWHIEAQPASRERFVSDFAQVLQTITDWAGYTVKLEKCTWLVFTPKSQEE